MVKKIFIKIINVYQRFLSPFLGPHCFFSPTCSEYTKQSLLKYGVVRSFCPVVARIFSCHPFTKKRRWDPLK